MADQRGSTEEPEGTPGTAIGVAPADERGISLEELTYSSSSYHAIVKPVTTAMILAALAVTFVTTPSTKRILETSLSNTYTVFDVSDDDESNHHSNAGKLALSLVNGLIIVSGIGALTFVIVLLYKYRCMKCLQGYMIFSSAALLGVLGGLMFDVFIIRFHIPLDRISFYLIIVNFALVGTTAIFYQTGIPMFITQTYLVLTSVILAWQLSHFNSWTAWSLLVCLALYDLCAVLTPCGPLKFLVNLMSEDDAPDLPGLLYEAQLPAGVDRPGRQARESTNRNRTTNETERRREGGSVPTNGSNSESAEHDATPTNAGLDSVLPSQSVVSGVITNKDAGEEVLPGEAQILPTIPLAIALIYRLEILTPACYASANQTRPLTKQGLSPSQLRAQTGVRFPKRGGKIVQKQDTAESNTGSPQRRNGNNTDMELKYDVLDRNGNVKRTLVVDEEGKVFEEMDPEHEVPGLNSSSYNNSIKLGLGDFIFYSVLVAKAAEYSFTTFAACTLVILAGLGSTLILLSVYHTALPALPISIFLGVTFYLLTRVSIEPWIETILAIPIYV